MRKRVDSFLETSISLLIFVLVIDVLWQVFTRFVLRDSSSFTEELARYILVWVSLLGACYGVGKEIHLGVDLLPKMLTAESRLRMEICNDLFILLFALLVLVIGGGRLVFISLHLNQLSAALRIPLGYVYLVAPLAGLFMIFYASCSIRESIRNLKR